MLVTSREDLGFLRAEPTVFPPRSVEVETADRVDVDALLLLDTSLLLGRDVVVVANSELL